ncbi:molecular chaperone [Gordonibacter sp. 28C]|uniref:TorD/DmsD family molecular chaperone n=1 Tax=Gordonibacter sp. 28C TaxID=2078569 RepID=UPI001314E9D5|nr:molecular chaperone TorD family protein [Gordonibacter sp. 28C]
MSENEGTARSVDASEAAELRDEMRARANMYAFFSKVFLREFDDEELARLGSSDAVPPLNERMADGSRRLARAVQVGGIDYRTRLAVEYARIFLSAGISEGTAAVPFESVYTSEDHLVMQDARDDVVALYRRHGLDVEPRLHTPEDHLGFEMEFLSTLAARSAEALSAGDDAAFAELARVQLGFLEGHVLNWIGDLAEDVEECAKDDFYPALMQIVIGYAELDVQNLRCLLE